MPPKAYRKYTAKAAPECTEDLTGYIVAARKQLVEKDLYVKPDLLLEEVIEQGACVCACKAWMHSW
jgi:hypothetical protein